ncbi:class I SAM-dependent methyltransferase [Fluviicola taffensis]|uniref:Methyltransferase type 12 n=1 Tax=Fluviicola taffensis (strain DSM 16823 / NCIMB 13979 / RW262) TaxID=755732 RepID=F2IC01_FLUTR|nr:class I SAM-dependent methyltransferase [Fluviicola taffensis]AEA42229.1 Methyltransferase type 12 [Fluviicola taffensis DSM 16823]
MNTSKTDLVVKNKYGYLEIAEKPTPKELEKYYAETYFQTSQGAYEAIYSKDELQFFDNSNHLKSEVIADFFKTDRKSKRKLLDVGCGEGFSMNYFFKQGWEVTGIDYSFDGVQKQNPAMESFVLQGDIYMRIEELIEKGEQYDVILILNVLEHVIDPVLVLKQLRKLVSTGGLLIILVPNDFSALQENLLADQKISKKFWVKTPDHLNYFSKESLIALCEDHQFKFHKCLSDFPIDYFLANPDSNYIEDGKKGKNCHQARMWLDNLHCSISIQKTIELYEAFANLGSGRQLTAYFTKP